MELAIVTSKLTEENSAGQQHRAVKKIQNGGGENEKDNLFLESKNTVPATLHVVDISKNLQMFKKFQKNLPMFPKYQNPSEGGLLNEKHYVFFARSKLPA